MNDPASPAPSLLGKLLAWARPRPPHRPEVREALQRTATILGPVIRATPGFERQLAPAVAYALDYCEEIVASLPQRVDIDRHAFASDPLVHALFAGASDIDEMLWRSPQLRNYLEPDAAHSNSNGSDSSNGKDDSDPNHEDEHLFALLATRRHLKHVLGVALEGQTLRSDVPQELLYFSDHTLAVLAPDADSAHRRLCDTTFDSLVKSFAAHVEAVRLEREGLREDRERERAHLTVLRSRPGAPEIAVHTRTIEELDNRLRESTGSLQPEHLLTTLRDTLLTPEMSLRLQPLAFALDRSGVIVNNKGPSSLDGPSIHRVEFSELIARDRRQYVVMPVRIRRIEAERAIRLRTEERPRYLVI